MDVTMAILGTLLKNKRAGEAKLAWNSPAFAGPETLDLRSSDVEHNGTIPAAHAGLRVGGENLSPTLAWHGTAPGCPRGSIRPRHSARPPRRPLLTLTRHQEGPPRMNRATIASLEQQA